MTDAKQKLAGSQETVGPAFLAVGKVRRPHGVHGEVVAQIYTDYPESIAPKKAIFLGEKHSMVVITSRRQHNEGLLLGFEGINSPEEAGRFRNQILYISTNGASELPEGGYYFHDLLDLKVEDEEGKLLGSLVEILETGANDVYVVKDADGRELLLPAIREVILKVDLNSKKMKVHLLPGLAEKDNLR
jgi:16S rRNA processing protein RimM